VIGSGVVRALDASEPKRTLIRARWSACSSPSQGDRRREGRRTVTKTPPPCATPFPEVKEFKHGFSEDLSPSDAETRAPARRRSAKLQLNDSACSYEPASRPRWAFGYRDGPRLPSHWKMFRSGRARNTT